MKKSFSKWGVLLSAALLLGLSSSAYAQATRTWVSGVGDDANPCSRTAPCKTFAGAISKTAAGGEIFSGGLMLALPLIATLLDPDPPPVLFIEEVENGLDPRTVGLVVDLMRAAAQSGRTQVIATTHSPYLLDMLDLDDVLLCERGDKGPAFSWPASRKEMKAWRDKFMPGRLYTMNALQRESAASSEVVPSTQGEAPEGGWGDSE